MHAYTIHIAYSKRECHTTLLFFLGTTLMSKSEIPEYIKPKLMLIAFVSMQNLT